MNKTICAIATGQGGAIGIIRVSGEKAISITQKIFRPASGQGLSLQKGYTISYGTIIDTEGSVIDEVLISVFRSPHSYTGENCVEISCHASSYILQKILELLIHHGCATAKPGEFTERAFLNGKMDLSQAEAVADVIAAQSASAHKIAINQIRGGISKELNKLREKLLNILSLLELELDFSDHEDLEFADRDELMALAKHINDEIDQLLGTFKSGNAIKNGIPVAIIGDTNAGKSTLLNRLVGEERAIVSDIRGTTRDVIEDTVVIDGVLFRFIDTAGIRETTDVIEQMGIDRTFSKLRQAEIVLWVVDLEHADVEIANIYKQIASATSDSKLIILLNKTDIHDKDESEIKEHVLSLIHSDTKNSFSHDISIFAISAKRGDGIDKLKATLSEFTKRLNTEDVVLSNVRHFDAFKRANEALLRVIDGLQNALSGEFISQDLHECTEALGEIIGKVSSQDVLNNIFSKFCIGK